MTTKTKTIVNLFKNFSASIKLVWKSHAGLVVVLFCLSLVTALVPFGISGSRALVIDELVASTANGLASERLLLAIALLIVAFLVSGFLHVISRYVGKMFWYSVEAIYEMKVLEKRSELDVAVYEDPKKNDLLIRVSENGVWRLQNFIDRQFYLFQDVIQVLTSSVILFAFQWWLLPVMVIGAIPSLLVEIKYGRDTWGLFDESSEERRRYFNLRQYFTNGSGIVELKLFQNIGYLLKKIQVLFFDFQNKHKLLERKKLWLQLFSLSISQVAEVVIIWWSINQVIHGQVLVGVFTFLLSTVGDFRSSLSSFFSNLARQYEDSLFVTDIFTLLALPTVIQKPTKGVNLSKNKLPDIKFENVSFAYPNTQKLVLQSISWHIPAGHKIALVGINGSGKTTLIKLLCRFYDPTEGRILVGGVDLREINLESWYRQLGVLFQEYVHYNMPVKEAIAQGNVRQKMSLGNVKQAASLSESDKFIQAWDNSYEQMLGREFTGGVDPSVGQWQKLALARVFYRNPHVMVLDEPTASIDAEAEAHIFDRLEKLAIGKTVILISHRFSTVRKANTILVLKDGKIHEQGGHDELMRKNGVYAELFRLQAKGYE